MIFKQGGAGTSLFDRIRVVSMSCRDENEYYFVIVELFKTGIAVIFFSKRAFLLTFTSLL
jgi:hypothetical protein